MRSQSSGLQLHAVYSAAGVQLVGAGFGLRVGAGSVERSTAFVGLHVAQAHVAGAARYVNAGAGVTESFRPTEAGIEQSFEVTRRLPGQSQLTIDVPVSGLTAAMVNNGVVDLRDAKGRVRATYSGLRVTDAKSRAVPAGLRVVSAGTIAIDVHDASAVYPLTVDPTWSMANELTATGGAANDYFGASVSVSGTLAVIGAPGRSVSGTDEGEAYIFTLADGSWSETAQLLSPDGNVYALFGESVSISGDTVVVGAPGENVGSNTGQGAAFVFTYNGSTWSSGTEVTASDGTEYDEFGHAVALSGSTAVVGAPYHSGRGASYVFASTGSTWSQAAELSGPSGATGDDFGWSVATNGADAIVGAPLHTVGSHSGQGEAYIYAASAAWSEVAGLTGGDSSAGDQFGMSVAMSGDLAVVGACCHTVGSNTAQGAAYVFSSSSGGWAQAAELTSSDGEADDQFGDSVAVSGQVLVVGAPNHPEGSNWSQGDAYIYTGSGASWGTPTEVASDDGTFGEEFGWSVSVSGASALIGAQLHNVPNPSSSYGSNVSQGDVYAFSSDLVEPQGTTPGLDLVGNGSFSEPACPCQVKGTVNPATGDFHATATDLTLPGAGLPLQFARTYDAQAAQAEVAAGAPSPALGYGWAYNLGMSLAYDTSSETATVTEEDGAQLTFTPYVAGTSPAWCTSAVNFCAMAPRVEATLEHNSGGTWTFTRYLGARTTFSFSSSGALTEVADQAGDTLSSSAYSPGSGQAACPSGSTCTAWSSSASGRELVLALNGSGQLVSVFDADSTLAASFTYSGTGCSAWGSAVPDLCTATGPGSIVATYTYDSGNSTSDLDYDMVTETPPGATAATTNSYNSSGQVTQQTDPSGAVTTLSYAGTNSTEAGGATTVTAYPLGTGTGEPEDTTVYQYSSNVLVAETTGSGTASASTESLGIDPASLLPMSSEDGDGNVSTSTYQTYSSTGGTSVSSGNLLTSTDALGNTTEYAYNAANQAWCQVAPAEHLDGVTCPSSPPSAPPSPGARDPDLGAAITFYNSSGQVTATTDALGNTTTYRYTSGVSGVPDGLVYCSVAPVAYQAGTTCPAYGASHVPGTTTESYDSAGDLTSSTNADGATTTNAYGVAGHPGLESSVTGPDGTVTSYAYDGAGQVTSQQVSFGSYSATTVYAYDTLGRQFCTVAPYDYANGASCPSSPPSSPPTPSSDPYLGATITTYDADGRAVQVTNPLGGITYDAYDQAGQLYCTVAPSEAAASVTCPSSPPSAPPTLTSDPYLGATITTYDADGRIVQVTNPLGGITLTSYDGAGNVAETTVESNSSTSAPTVVTAYSYDADGRAVSTTVDPGGTLAATTVQAYDPDGNVYCNVSANAYASGTYQCPAWQASWVAEPPSPTSLYSSTPSSSQADKVTTTFYDGNGDGLQSTDADVHTTTSAYDGDGREYCSADPTNVAAWLAAHSSGTYPYLCPATPPSSPPSAGSGPGYATTIYDAAGQVSSSTDPVGGTTTYTYAPGGQVLTTTNPGGQVTTNCYYSCAARRLPVSPAQPGMTQREVIGPNGLPRPER